MRLVFVHGMRQEGKDAAALKKQWEDALISAWEAKGLAKPSYTLEMPFYGKILNNLVEEVRGGSAGIVTRGEGGPSTFTSFEADLIREMAENEGITDEDVRSELGRGVVERGPLNWEWVQAIARLLERKVPALGRLSLKFVRQVDGYLARPHIRKAVDDKVGPSLLQGSTVVVSHSLGTIVSYLLLRKAGEDAEIPLFVTLGSPLGIGTVKQYLRPPALEVPAGVTKWLNGTDERDYVALHSRLDRNTFAEGIENVSDLSNRSDDAHAIVDYLSDSTICQRIHAAL